MKKILLIQAISMEGLDIERVYPIGLVTVGSILERSGRYLPVLFDMNLDVDPYASLEKLIEKENPDAIGLSFRNVDPLGNRTTSLVVPLKLTARFLRRRFDKPIFIGGTGYSLFSERLLDEIPEIDFGFQGEAENQLIPLVDALFEDGDVSHIPGAVTRQNGKAVLTPPDRTFDMKNYQRINRDLLDPVPYLQLNAYVESIGIESKRGCVFDCAYCSYPLLQGKRMRVRPIDDVLDELEELKEKYGLVRFHFTDPIVNCPADDFDRLCQGMIDRKLDLKWSGFFREDLITEERAALYAKSGCECFSLSPDGLTQNSLDLLNKHLKRDEIVACAEILSKTGVCCVYHLLVNTPEMNEQEIEEAKELISDIYKAHDDTGTVGTVVLNLIRILPQTRIEEIAREDKTIDETDDLLYPVYYDPKEYRTLRYELEVFHQDLNNEMWQKQRKRYETDTP